MKSKPEIDLPPKAGGTAIAMVPEAVPEQSETTAILSMIERAASDPNVDIDKMERLLAMQERALAKRDERAFNDAMSAAQAEMRSVATDSKNDQTKSRYASYFALNRAIRPIYVKHGFGLSFDTGEGAPENCIRVLCYVTAHGHTRKYQVDMPADGKGAKGGDVMTRTHAVGSGMTYGQRYLLKLIFNIAIGEDDDGNQAADGSANITEEQAVALTKMIEESGGNVAKFCSFAKVRCLAEIRADRYDAAVAAVKSAAVKRKAKAS